MHITKVELQNFKRFTNLTIDGIPADAKLVLLIGSNGSGKSSVFDAFEVFNAAIKKEFENGGELYYKKNVANKLRVTLEESDSLSTIGDGVGINLDRFNPYSFYGRSSLRQLPQLTRTTIGSVTQADILSDKDRPKLFIERDNRFENDVERISDRVLVDVFQKGNSGQQITDTFVTPINRAFDRIYDTLEGNKLSLIQIIPPLAGKPAQLTFKKGKSEIHYDLLSAGEKEIFNVLFNLLARKDQYTDTVYFFDELDLHLNTRLQFNLLKEITENWIPENCQLWTASHSLGFIDYARQYEKGVLIDFDDLDFDQPQTLLPQPKQRLDVYDIAVPKEMLFEIMQDKTIVLCENQNDEYYNLLALPNTLFVGMKDARSLFLQIKNDARYHALRDRDFLSDTEIERLEKQYPTYRILRYYDFENYLYHPDNIAELNPPDFDRAAYIADIIRQKKERFNALLLNLKDIRKSYEELKTGNVMDETPDSIVDDLQSDEFERFYKYFDMKDAFNKVFLARLNLDKKRLVQTAWFRQQIESVLNS